MEPVGVGAAAGGVVAAGGAEARPVEARAASTGRVVARAAAMRVGEVMGVLRVVELWVAARAAAEWEGLLKVVSERGLGVPTEGVVPAAVVRAAAKGGLTARVVDR